MRVLVVSWEYPPVVVGGLGRHVDALSREMAGLGHDVTVLTRHPTGTDATSHPTACDFSGPVRVLRVAEDPPLLEFGRDLVAWTLAWNHAAVRAALVRLGNWRPEVVHAHDWLAAHAGIGLADVFDVPLVATVHATEAGRNAGRLDTPLQRQIHSVEWWLARRADALVTCSQAMRAEVARLFTPDAPIAVVPNGIVPRRWAVDAEQVATARRRWAPGGGGPLLVNLGRLEYEKGVQDLLAALPRIRERCAGTRLVVVGTGTQAAMLAEAARGYGVDGAVTFAGHVPDDDLAATLAAADAVVLPSRYEPFGIVALEVAAAGAPLVAAQTGGLAEVVGDDAGLSFPPGDVDALADAVARTLGDPDAAARRVARARARLTTDFDWARIAARTAEVLRAAQRRPAVALGRPTIASGDLLGAPEH